MANVAPLLDYIKIISPEFRRPAHMWRWAKLFDRIVAGEAVRALCTLPIRHFKTETTLHGVLWLLEHDPSLRIVVLTFSHKRAMWLGKRLRVLAKSRDTQFKDEIGKGTKNKIGPRRGDDTIELWTNESEGGVNVMSADMSSEGFDCHILLVDDPIDEHGIKAKDKRDAVDEAINHYIPRCMRNGKPGPVLIVASRFDQDDPIGRRLERYEVEWELVHEPAIRPDGSAFAPDVWDVPALLKIRAEMKEWDPYERTWWSRYQGDPRPLGGDIEDGQRYETLPMFAGFRDAIGFDLSFTKDKRSDWSAVVVGRVYNGALYIREFQRFRAELPEAMIAIRAAWNKYGRCPVYSFMSGPEVSVAHLFAREGVPINVMRASAPKFVRNRRTADAHNAGRILYPACNPQISATIERLKKFKGNEKDEDDEFDALASLWEGAAGRSGGVIFKTFGRAYQAFFG